jgi:hypothetical protein
MKKPRGFIFNVLGSSIEIRLTKECINDCSHSGSCDADVEFWVNKLRPYLDEISTDVIRKCLKPYGAWDEEELLDNELNLHRFLWCAATSAKEENSCWTSMDS